MILGYPAMEGPVNLSSACAPDGVIVCPAQVGYPQNYKRPLTKVARNRSW